MSVFSKSVSSRFDFSSIWKYCMWNKWCSDVIYCCTAMSSFSLTFQRRWCWVREGEKLTVQFHQSWNSVFSVKNRNKRISVQFTVRYRAVKSCRTSFGLDSIQFPPKMAKNKIGSNSSISKSEGKSKSDGNGEVAEPKKTLASRKFIRLGTIVWAKVRWLALVVR